MGEIIIYSFENEPILVWERWYHLAREQNPPKAQNRNFFNSSPIMTNLFPFAKRSSRLELLSQLSVVFQVSDHRHLGASSFSQNFIQLSHVDMLRSYHIMLRLQSTSVTFQTTSINLSRCGCNWMQTFRYWWRQRFQVASMINSSILVNRRKHSWHTL
jgi:hypothetical protein